VIPLISGYTFLINSVEGQDEKRTLTQLQGIGIPLLMSKGKQAVFQPSFAPLPPGNLVPT